MAGLFGSLAAVVLNAPTATAAVGTNQAINYQGRLLTNTGAVVPDGTYAMEFKIYQDGSGRLAGDIIDGAIPAGTLKWTEDWVYGVNTPDNRITVRNGYFSVNLGTICTFTSTSCTVNTGQNGTTNVIIDWNQSALWLSVAVGQNLGTNATFATSTPDPEMLPMRRLSSSVYSLNSNALGGLTSSQFVQLGQNPTTAQVDASTNSAIFLNKTSTGNFIQFQKTAGTDAFIVDNSGNIAFGNNSAKSIAFASAATASGQGLSIMGQTAGATANNGGAVSIQAGQSTTSGAGGQLSLLGGNGTGAGGVNGSVVIDTGLSGTAGAISIATSAVSHTISIGTGGVASAVESVNIGSSSSTSSTNIYGGVNGSYAAISLQTATLGVIAIGTTSSNTIQIGAVGTMGNNSTVNIANSTGASQTVVIGSTNGASSTTIQGGTSNINLSTNSATAGVIVKDLTSNASSFQIQNSQSSSLVSADTTTQNLIINSDFEAGVSNGWSNVASTSAQDVSGTNQEFGSGSLAVTTTAAANSGVQDNGFTSTITPSGAQAYTLSFWAKTSVTLTTLAAGYNMGAADIPCTTSSYQSQSGSTTVTTTAPVRFYCTFTPTAGTLSYVYITQGSTATVRIIYLDGVQLEAGLAPTNYRTGTLNVNTVNIASTLGIKYTDSGNTSALSVNNATGTLFNTDTNLNRVTIGNINGCSAIIGQGRLCLGQSINAGVGGGIVSQNNTLINASTVGNSSYASLIYLNDTGSGGNVNYDVLQDNTGSTNSAATINGITVKTKSANAGNLIDLQGGAAGTTSVFTVTNAGVVNVGIPTTDAVQTNLQLDSFNAYTDAGSGAGACSTTVNQGAMYFNTITSSIRACANGSTWSDLATNSDLGLQLFGILPTSGPAAGDIAGVSTTDATRGPCWVYMGSVANSVRWTGCTMYTNGRRQIIAAQSTDFTTGITAAAANFQNLCITTAGTAPSFGTASATETSATVPAWSATAPAVCLATIKEIAAGGGIGAIYDTRVFTTSDKQYTSLATVSSPGQAVKPNGLTGQFAPTSATTSALAGVVAQWSGTVQTNLINAILITSGGAYVKTVTTGAPGTYARPSATAGYVTTSALVTVAQTDIPYTYLGLAQSSLNAPGTQCSVIANANTCLGSILVNINIR